LRGCGTISGVPTLRIAQDPAAVEMLSRDPLALVVGMLLDQHMRQRSSGAVDRPAHGRRHVTAGRHDAAVLRPADR
jgi:hypothetical protein